MLKKIITSTVALAISPVVSAHSTEHSDFNNVGFFGASTAENSNFFYGGAVFSPFQYIGHDGFILRTAVSSGTYEYDQTATTQIKGDSTSFEGMVGYQLFDFSIFKRVTAYLGFDHQNHKLNAIDVLNKVQGEKSGAKGIVEFDYALTDTLDLSFATSYSSVYDSYWTQTKIIIPSEYGFSFGPQIIASGSESYDNQRLGLFIGDIKINDRLTIGAAAGFSNASRRGDNSAFASIGGSFPF